MTMHPFYKGMRIGCTLQHGPLVVFIVQGLKRRPYYIPGISHNLWQCLILYPQGHEEKGGPEGGWLDAAIPCRCYLPLLYVVLLYITPAPILPQSHNDESYPEAVGVKLSYDSLPEANSCCTLPVLVVSWLHIILECTHTEGCCSITTSLPRQRDVQQSPRRGQSATCSKVFSNLILSVPMKNLHIPQIMMLVPQRSPPHLVNCNNLPSIEQTGPRLVCRCCCIYFWSFARQEYWNSVTA